MKPLFSFFTHLLKEPQAKPQSVELTCMDELGFREQQLASLEQYVDLLRAHSAVVFGLTNAQKEANIATIKSQIKHTQNRQCELEAKEEARQPLGETNYLRTICTR